MKAKKIQESLKRGGDPLDTMNVGKAHLSPYKPEDQISRFGREYIGMYPKGSGGSFQNALFKAFYAASHDNREKLVEAFPEFFNELDPGFDYYK